MEKEINVCGVCDEALTLNSFNLIDKNHLCINCLYDLATIYKDEGKLMDLEKMTAEDIKEKINNYGENQMYYTNLMSDTFDYSEVRAKEVAFRKNFDIRAIEEGWNERRKVIEEVAFDYRSDILDAATHGNWYRISNGVIFVGHGKAYWLDNMGNHILDEGVTEFVWLKIHSLQTIEDLKEYLSPKHFRILDEMSDYVMNGGKFND